MTTHKRMLGMLLLFAALVMSISLPVEAKSYKTYKISASTKPCTNAYQKRAKAKKAYSATYMLKSYLDLIDKKGGGTLVFKKGTYNIYENLYIPSNTTLKFEKGVKIVAKKGVAGVFNLIPPNKVGKKSWAKKYASSKNVKFIGTDNVVFDLGTTSATAIYMTHNQSVSVENIEFKKNGSSRYIIELNGVKNVTIRNCKFTGTAAQKTNAVSVDIPAKKRTQTKSWSLNDDTVNQKVTIENCTFDKLNRAIVTLRYVSNKYNTDFKITGNRITNIKDDAIRAINWKNFSITGNTIKSVASGGSITTAESKLKRAVYMAGAVSPKIMGNTFEDVPRAIEFNVYTNTDTKLKSYAATVNSFTQDSLQNMLNGNTIINNREYVIRVYKTQGGESDRYHYPDDKDTYYITPNDTPYRNVYLNYPDYNKNTRQYYVFRSVMDQVERNGGGTVVVTKGTYNITNEIPIPSNTTIRLEAGVIMQKKAYTGKTIESTNGVFAFVSPTFYSGTTANFAKYSGYNGLHDVTITGPDSGTATINLNNYDTGIGIVMAHAKNVTIKNLNFTGGNGGHYIELDASRNVTVTNCIFTGHKDSESGNKEAINLDTPDKNTQGFVRGWTTYDCTPDQNVRIINNTFKDLEVGIGSHSYSQNKPHKDIYIENNSIDGCDYCAIQMLNWENVTVKGNTMSNISPANVSTNFVFRIRGVKHPKIFGNVINTANRVAIVEQGKQTGKGAADNYAAVPYELSAEEWNNLTTQNKLINVTEPIVQEYPVWNSVSSLIKHECTSN